jgi:hypothetical protein
MNTKMGLYFQLEITDPSVSLSIVRLALNKLEQLGKDKVNVEYFELRVTDSGQAKNSKHVYMKLDGQGHTYISSCASHEWKKAFMDTFAVIDKQLQVPGTSTVNAQAWL